MYKRIFIISCFFFAALLSGCVSATGPSFKEVTTTPSNKSLIYIYRPDYFRGCGLRYPVFIDNQQIGLLSNRGYLYSEVEPGQHTIKVQAWEKAFAANSEYSDKIINYYQRTKLFHSRRPNH